MIYFTKVFGRAIEKMLSHQNTRSEASADRNVLTRLGSIHVKMAREKNNVWLFTISADSRRGPSVDGGETVCTSLRRRRLLLLQILTAM